MEFFNKLRHFALVGVFLTAFAASAEPAEPGEAKESFKVSKVILDHVLDDHVWHIADGLVIHLPVIVYSEAGLDVFSSSNFFNGHEAAEYNGYKLEHGHITRNGNRVWDFSITKNAAMLFLTAAVIFTVFLSAASMAKKRRGKSPKGIQSFLEPVILFVRDEVVKPYIGPKYERFLPYMLTLFFFILIGNILGLLPGSANLTGNIAVTMVLAVITFIITHLKSNKDYWKHIFWTPGIPLLMRPIFIPVEVIGIFTKPFALMLRLFVAITAGHILILSVICLIFVFKSFTVGIGASLAGLLINLVEILVAGIQAYVFTLFSSLYIGMAMAAPHDEKGHEH